MITLIYAVTPDNKVQEIEWLKNQMIFPSVNDWFDWTNNEWRVRVGVIVSPAAALTIKLRHPLQFQSEYKQR